ncbi:unnamed protein product [Adineta ricciae]|uniref:RING-type domain-containing protein n=1 Tax=Adineta ricciae TaxID=249248 RepID=A0A813ZZ42_ADIRI|nr:unnamed protein product [Adineta ricciae]
MISTKNAISSDRLTNLKDQIDLVLCPICGDVLWKPVTCSSCENSFCSFCIDKWLFEQQKEIIPNLDNETHLDYSTKSLSLTRCPFNCSPYIQRNCPSLLRIILSKLNIECRNKINGCREILSYEQLEKHQEECCPYQVIQCSGCKKFIRKDVFDEENHFLMCRYVKFQCTKCESVFRREDKHDRFDCIEGQIRLLEQRLMLTERKYSTICEIQRKKLDIFYEKFAVIEQNYEIDNDDSIERTNGV